ncbi:Armadillo-type fold [Plasmopara halstedii]|uniref:Armadillo-type fold n=1 Tax=Plasmopara halstedii TaxID=4781 RepID=A0A0P1AHR1_PLAHL|nr:Armadillo-type fold [Plasmopara halstedii]CEG40767.1 Armadillo-type fold [Plasmopara halstedii]|eukprot:XP_024577136.1 Armadillo-type fold [Plasmopara halstedii]
MGGAVSDLRRDIHIHVLLSQHSPLLLEPILTAVQYFLHIAELGDEGNSSIEDDNNFIGAKRIDKQETSIQIELLTESPAVTEALLHAVCNSHKLQISRQHFKRWYERPWRRFKSISEFPHVSFDQVEHFRHVVLRTSLRCLCLLSRSQDGRDQLKNLNGLAILQEVAFETQLDDVVKKSVAFLLSRLYSENDVVQLIAVSNVTTVVKFMKEYEDQATVQVAGIQRLASLLAKGMTRQYSGHDQIDLTTIVDHKELRRGILFDEFDTFDVSPLVTDTLNRFDVDTCLGLYIQVCRFISLVAIDIQHAKAVGQNGGVQGSIRLLLKSRAMQREKKIHVLSSTTSMSAPQTQQLAVQHVTSSSLAKVTFTPSEIGQQALWALDSLATLDLNISLMKLHGLQYVLEEIYQDPDRIELQTKLIITRRLHRIRLRCNPLHKSQRNN